jgi:hypothetical protein
MADKSIPIAVNHCNGASFWSGEARESALTLAVSDRGLNRETEKTAEITALPVEFSIF